MSPVLGNAIVILALAILVFFCGRSCIRMMKDELSGKCTGCANGCSHQSSPAVNAVNAAGSCRSNGRCSGCCASCTGCSGHKTEND